jgi:hypothetical protein
MDTDSGRTRELEEDLLEQLLEAQEGILNFRNGAESLESPKLGWRCFLSAKEKL